MPVIIYNGSFNQLNGTFTIGQVVTDTSLRLFLNAGNTVSYPGSGSTWFDISGYGNNASLTAATASAFSNYAIKFNRSTNTRAIVSSLDLSATSTITINMWVKFLSLPTGGGDTFRFLAELSDNYNSFSDSFFTAIATELSTNRWFTQDKGNVGYNAKNLSTPLPQTNTWYNFTVVYDHTQTASNERTFYIDGVNQTNIASTEGGTTYNSDNTNNFGNRPLYIGGRSTTAFSADMDLGVFQIYNKALNATEVSQSYESYKANYLNIVTSGSVFLADATNITSYPGSGNSWYDISGNSNTGSLINGTVYNASSSFTLDGVDDSIEFNSGSAINDLTQATWTTWVNWTEDLSVTSTSFLYKSDNNGSAGWFICVDSSRGGIGVNIVCPTNKRYFLPSSQTPARNTWYMLTVTWDGTLTSTGGIGIYINGVKNNTTPQTNIAGVGTRTSDAAQIFDVGNSRPGSAFHFGGGIGFVQIHNRVLTDAEITQNYNATKKIYGL